MISCFSRFTIFKSCSLSKTEENVRISFRKKFSRRTSRTSKGRELRKTQKTDRHVENTRPTTAKQRQARTSQRKDFESTLISPKEKYLGILFFLIEAFLPKRARTNPRLFFSCRKNCKVRDRDKVKVNEINGRAFRQLHNRWKPNKTVFRQFFSSNLVLPWNVTIRDAGKQSVEFSAVFVGKFHQNFENFDPTVSFFISFATEKFFFLRLENGKQIRVENLLFFTIMRDHSFDVVHFRGRNLRIFRNRT